MSTKLFGCLLGLTFFVLCACSKTKTEEAPGAAPAPPPQAAEARPMQDTVASVPVPKPEGGGLKCEKLLSQALRDKFLAGAAMTSRAQTSSTSIACRFSGGKLTNGLDIIFSCTDNGALPEVVKETTTQFKKMGYLDVPGVGRAAVRNGEMQVALWDDDTNCQVTITGIEDKVNLIDLAKDLVASLNKASFEM